MYIIALYVLCTCLLTILVCLGIKVVYWRKSGSLHGTQLMKSFFKWYDIYHRVNTFSSSKQSFMKVSNNVNVVFWLVLLFCLAVISQLHRLS